MKKAHYLVISLICVVIGFFLGAFLCKKSAPEPDIQIKEVIVKDTIEKIKYSEPIIITKVKTKIIKTSDSQVVANPFISKLDTIIRNDTISAVYEFPQNLLSIRFNSPPDTIMMRKVEIIRSNQDEKRWWEVPLYIAGGLILGFLIGSAGK